MKLTSIALDYDGTIARHDRVAPSVLDAIADARRRGIAVMLVTGRRLDDLRRVAGDLHFVDGVVAENGAVLHFPAAGLTTALVRQCLRSSSLSCGRGVSRSRPASAWWRPTRARQGGCWT